MFRWICCISDLKHREMRSFQSRVRAEYPNAKCILPPHLCNTVPVFFHIPHTGYLCKKTTCEGWPIDWGCWHLSFLCDIAPLQCSMKRGSHPPTNENATAVLGVFGETWEVQRMRFFWFHFGHSWECGSDAEKVGHNCQYQPASQPLLEDEVFPLSFDSEASPGGLHCSAHTQPYLSAFQCTSVNWK